MIRSFIFLIALLLTPAHGAGTSSDLQIITVVGTGGTDAFETVFTESAARWEKAAAKGGAAFTLIGGGEKAAEQTDHDQLKEALMNATGPELWIVLIGHGSFDSRTVKFNLRGPDFTDKDLANWLEDYPGELAVINTASSSGSFIRTLSGPKRIIITATKNEAEASYTHFGNYFSEAVGGLEAADLDNDDQVSLLESFLYASHETAAFYEKAGRLATEHALIDDNGDAAGSRREWFEGITAVKVVRKDAEPDGEFASQKVLVKNSFEQRLSAEQRSERDKWEREVKRLRRERDTIDDDQYYEDLEALLLKLARLYREVGDS
ncbi:MAG: hypothetical protein P1U68_15085 [Verrucomicrobiales bacterium]|nr:hypothetical protein [Verrucomicrobiales bacterium]